MNARLFSAAMLALSAFVATPAAAQVNGIGVANPAVAVAASQALNAAYQQIDTTFATQRTQLEQLQQQRAGLVRQFDTNNDGQLNDAEQAAAQANTAVVQQVTGLDQQLNTLQQPITMARAYVVEQIGLQLNPAVQQVITANSLQLILSPDAVLFRADAAEVTDDIIAQLNVLVPAASTVVPQGWQPQQATVDLFQQVQEVRLAVAQQQAAAAAAQQPVAGPAVPGR